MEKDDLVKHKKQASSQPSKLQLICDTVWLAATTVLLLVVYITSGLSSRSSTRFGFKNNTGDVSDIFFTQVTPAGFTFAVQWGLIYTWQALWVVYAWTFVFRPKMPRTIFTGVYIGYTLVSATNITWIYIWGNLHVVAACVVLFLFNVFIYSTIAMLVGYFYKVREAPHRMDTILTWVLPVNGLFFYATWTTIASLLNLAAALQYSKSNVSGTTSGTASLSLLLIIVLVYFVLENTVLYCVLRYVLSVYPVVIWALIGAVYNHWGVEGEERNSRFALGLLIVTIVLFIIRIIVVVIFGVVRPLCKAKTPAKV